MSRATTSFLLLLALFGAALFGSSPATAAEQKPCWERVLDDWQEDGRIDGVYPASCYREALRRVPEDVRAYSSFADDVRRARQDALRTRELESAGGAQGGSRENPRLRRIQERERAVETGRGDEGPIDSALNRLGPDDSDSVPLPLLILAALAAALMIAGGAGLAHRKLRARRPTP